MKIFGQQDRLMRHGSGHIYYFWMTKKWDDTANEKHNKSDCFVGDGRGGILFHIGYGLHYKPFPHLNAGKDFI